MPRLGSRQGAAGTQHWNTEWPGAVFAFEAAPSMIGNTQSHPALPLPGAAPLHQCTLHKSVKEFKGKLVLFKHVSEHAIRGVYLCGGPSGP